MRQNPLGCLCLWGCSLVGRFLLPLRDGAAPARLGSDEGAASADPPQCPDVSQSHPCFSLQNCSCSWGEPGEHQAAGAAKTQQWQNLPGAAEMVMVQKPSQDTATLPSTACCTPESLSTQRQGCVFSVFSEVRHTDQIMGFSWMHSTWMC